MVSTGKQRVPKWKPFWSWELGQSDILLGNKTGDGNHFIDRGKKVNF